MNVHKELLDAIKDVGTLMEALSAFVMTDIKHIMMIQPSVLVCNELCRYICGNCIADINA